MLKVSELRTKEVINVLNGRRLGIIMDLDLDLEEGCVKGLIIPGQQRFLGLFGADSSVYIPWEQVIRIGDDVILVEQEAVSHY